VTHRYALRRFLVYLFIMVGVALGWAAVLFLLVAFLEQASGVPLLGRRRPQ